MNDITQVDETTKGELVYYVSSRCAPNTYIKHTPPYQTPQGNKILVPLTSSLYVPGKIRDPEHVVIDIGTGYYVKKVGVFVDTDAAYGQTRYHSSEMHGDKSIVQVEDRRKRF